MHRLFKSVSELVSSKGKLVLAYKITVSEDNKGLIFTLFDMRKRSTTCSGYGSASTWVSVKDEDRELSGTVLNELDIFLNGMKAMCQSMGQNESYSIGYLESDRSDDFDPALLDFSTVEQWIPYSPEALDQLFTQLRNDIISSAEDLLAPGYLLK